MNFLKNATLPSICLNLFLLVFSSILVVASYQHDQYNVLYNNLGQPSFRPSKNILFGVYSGGSSHSSWAVRILNELSLRGHNITYAASDELRKSVEQYSHIKSISLGQTPYYPVNIHDSISSPIQWKRIKEELNLSIESYDTKFKRMQSIISSYSIDAMICDTRFIECIDGARNGGIPLVITMLEIDSQDRTKTQINKRELEMTSDHEIIAVYKSFKKRFYMKFIFPVNFYWKMGSQLISLQKKRSLPLWQIPSTTNDNNRDVLKIVNNLFGGTELARSIDPLVEMIGPIFNSHYAPISSDVQEFLDKHQRVVFVALDQQHDDTHWIKTSKSQGLVMRRIFSELLHMQEIGLIDGFIWDIGKSSHHHMLLSDTSSFVTHSGSRFNVTGLWQQQYPHVRLIAQAPQFAILKHPSVITFLSHGESLSLFESLYAGKRTVVKPIFEGSPSANAIHFEQRRIGSYLRMDHHYSDKKKDEFEPLRRVIQDRDGLIQSNVDQYQTLIQIHAKYGVVKGADLVEEVIFTSDKDGRLQHRQDVTKKLSFLKVNDYDLYICLSGLVFSLMWVVRFVYIKILRTYYILLLVTGKINKVKLP